MKHVNNETIVLDKEGRYEMELIWLLTSQKPCGPQISINQFQSTALRRLALRMSNPICLRNDVVDGISHHFTLLHKPTASYDDVWRC